jgi:hypothetical protein
MWPGMIDQPYLDFLAATAFSTSDADPAFQKLCEEKPHLYRTEPLEFGFHHLASQMH